MFDRITFDPAIMGGRACIRGMRIPVSVIVSQIVAEPHRPQLLGHRHRHRLEGGSRRSLGLASYAQGAARRRRTRLMAPTSQERAGNPPR